MIITISELINSGVAISDDISNSEIEFAINTMEHFYLRPALGEHYEHFIEQNPSQTYSELLPLVKSAMYHIVYAYILQNRNIRATRYGSVVKNDEYSNSPSESNALMVCKAEFEIGESYIQEVQLELHYVPELKNKIFDTLLY